MVLCCGWPYIEWPFGKSDGNSISNKPYVVYSFTDVASVYGQSTVFNGGPTLFWTKLLISIISRCMLGRRKDKEDLGSVNFGSSRHVSKISVEMMWSRAEMFVDTT
jgi:hypothetical protein